MIKNPWIPMTKMAWCIGCLLMWQIPTKLSPSTPCKETAILPIIIDPIKLMIINHVKCDLSFSFSPLGLVTRLRANPNPTRRSLQSSINSHDLNMSQHSLASNWQIFNKMSKPRTNQKNSRFLTLDVNTIETQTSLTDLSGLAAHKSKEEKSTQCNLDQATGTTTTSSSQTEYKHPIDAHVT